MATREIVHPTEQMVLAPAAASPAMRVIDLVAPLARGQRALIASPPNQARRRSSSSWRPRSRRTMKTYTSLPCSWTSGRRRSPTSDVDAWRIFASSNDMDVRSHLKMADAGLAAANARVEQGGRRHPA